MSANTSQPAAVPAINHPTVVPAEEPPTEAATEVDTDVDADTGDASTA